jgi:hypothetical protein
MLHLDVVCKQLKIYMENLVSIFDKIRWIF